jgi:oxygen-independent coproporphyrinogen-3 oxidase
MSNHPIIPIQTAQSLRPTNHIVLESLPPLSLYIHFPWCVKKCPYCDFNSHAINDQGLGFDENRYLDALCKDLEESLPLIWGRRIHSIFIGGGTPSLLSPKGLDRLLADVRARVGMDSDIEITLEANPGSVESEKFSAYAKSGVNRISLGIQSFNERHLKDLGRVHSASEAHQAIKIAKQFFKRVNLDLMYGLPMQSLEEASSDLQTALSFQTDHVSLYQLTLEPNTLFAKFPPPLPNDDLIADMQSALIAQLATAGLHRYEISAYAKNKSECFHNLNYWTFGDYLGLGPGAHGKLSYRDHVVREVRHRHPRSWMEATTENKSALQSSERVAAEDLPFEFAMNAFRLSKGFSLDLFSRRTGLPLQRFLPTLDELELKGLVHRDTKHVAPTELGCRFLNDLIQAFLRDA